MCNIPVAYLHKYYLLIYVIWAFDKRLIKIAADEIEKIKVPRTTK